MQILPVSNKDEDIVYKMTCELEEMTLDRSAFHEAFSHNMKDSSIQYFFCVDNGEKKGMASIRILMQLHHADKIAEIEELYVGALWRKKGVGTFLFQAMKEIAEMNGCYQIELSSHEKRKGAHAFYERQQMNRCHIKFTINLKS